MTYDRDLFWGFLGQVDHQDSERIISPYERGSNVHQEVKQNSENLRLLKFGDKTGSDSLTSLFLGTIRWG